MSTLRNVQRSVVWDTFRQVVYLGKYGMRVDYKTRPEYILRTG